MRCLLANYVLLMTLVSSTFAADSNAALGINLSGPADWNTELPLLDAFRFSRDWISQREAAPWGKGPELSLDEHGWIKNLQPNCWADTPLMTNCDGAVPTGQWLVLYDGKGELSCWGANANAHLDAPGHILFDLKESKGFFLRIRATDPDDYIRNIRVLPPGVTQAAIKANPWNPRFLSRWHGVRCLRFMDFMHTNDSPVVTWNDRPRVDDASWSKGMPLELMCDLANRLDADPWFCLPHLADDDYIRQFARQAKQLLKPNRHVWIEYSNEVWNGQFQQHRYAAQQGQKLGFADKEWEAAWRYTAHRSLQVFKIWEDVFGGPQRLTRVLAAQAANSYVSDRICEFHDAYRHADALAIAPYVTFNVEPSQADAVVSMGVDGLLNRMEHERLTEATEWMRAQKKCADRWKLRLVAYEGGQHIVGVQGGENNDDLTKLFHAANKHPRMGKLYQQYLEAWTATGGDLFCAFNSVETWSKWGSWGLMQRDGENPADYPKFTATLRWAASRGQNMNAGK